MVLTWAFNAATGRVKMIVAQRLVRCRRCNASIATTARPGNTIRCPECRYAQRLAPAAPAPGGIPAGRGLAWDPPSPPPAAPVADGACPTCAGVLAAEPGGTTWLCPRCPAVVPPPGVLAPYERDGQPRQARTTIEQFADRLALAAQQDAMLDGITTLNKAGVIPAGSQRDAVARAGVKGTTTREQLAAIGRALASAPAEPGPPVVAGQVIAGHARRAPGPPGSADDPRRAQWRDWLHETAAGTGYFTPAADDARPARALPAAPQPGDLVPARYATTEPATRTCRRCRRAPAVIAAEPGDPSAALVAEIGDTAALSALCGLCLATLQAAYPGTWRTTPAETW